MISQSGLEYLIETHRTLGDAKLADAMASYSAARAGRGCVSEFLQSAGMRATAESRRLSAECVRRGFLAITLLCREYPERIQHFLGRSSPPVLYVMGNVQLLDPAGVSIIGTRRPSPLGRAAARSYASALALAGRPVVSGNAPGIDAAAHSAALEAGGATIVFAPSAPDRFEPVFDAPCESARVLAVSRFVPGSATQKWFFLGRNELAAAHAGAAIVAETGTRGGTLNTVQHIRRFRRPLFATRMPPEAKHSRAHEMLLASGARPLPPECAPGALRRLLHAAEAPMAGIHSENPDLFQMDERHG